MLKKDRNAAISQIGLPRLHNQVFALCQNEQLFGSIQNQIRQRQETASVQLAEHSTFQREQTR